MSDVAPKVLSCRRFTIEDQELFGRLSGDANPIHLDAIAARRSVVGDVVVHGVHTVLWALEQVASSSLCSGGIVSLDVRFPKPVYLEDEVRLLVQSHKETYLRLSAVVGGKIVASICLSFGFLPQGIGDVQDGVLLPATTAKDIAFADLSGHRGTVPYAVAMDSFAAVFPAAAACFGAAALRDLAACSRLVGMHCPGLRSVFSRLTLNWQQRGLAAPLTYQVINADARFSLVTISVEGAGVSGSINAFSPQPPPNQLTMRELALRINPGDFAGQRALVVGGSRGLGELTAKAIAAGGGHVAITYAVGRKEAERVVDEIRQFGGEARCLPYDATRAAAPQLAALQPDLPSHVYYYATCQIFRAKTMAFDAALLNRFLSFYVHGFHALCQALRDAGVEGLACFYPSSVAVEDRPRGMTEYAIAKAAGEVLVSDLGSLFPGYRAHQLRLPRLLTDQTAVVSPQSLPEAIDILLPVLQAMQRG
jgi:hypothetical protein